MIKKFLLALAFLFIPLYCFSSDLLIQQDEISSIRFLGDWAGVEYRVAQSFTLSATTTIDKVMIDIDTIGGGSPSTACTVRIETNNAGVPSGTLAHANATVAGTLAENTYVTWDFTDFELAAGDYWVVMSCANQANNNVWQIHDVSPSAYSGGVQAHSENGGSTWTAEATEDMTFRVYGVAQIVASGQVIFIE